VKESTRRKLDRIYQPRRRRLLDQTYRGDPADPDNTTRILHAELYGPLIEAPPSWRDRLARWWHRR
jgi:hypothetical protein